MSIIVCTDDSQEVLKPCGGCYSIAREKVATRIQNNNFRIRQTVSGLWVLEQKIRTGFIFKRDEWVILPLTKLENGTLLRRKYLAPLKASSDVDSIWSDRNWYVGSYDDCIATLSWCHFV